MRQSVRRVEQSANSASLGDRLAGVDALPAARAGGDRNQATSPDGQETGGHVLEQKMTSQEEQLAFCFAPSLTDEQMGSWRSFAAELPSAHYRQDPMWAEIERSDKRGEAREPWFFWAEAGGSICLTALGVRRRLPIPGYAFWEFNRGPNFVEVAALDRWLPWLLGWVGRGTVRLRVQPPIRLNEGGDNVETVLERHGFERHRTRGGWTTLLVDLASSEEEIMAQFRPATQRAIRKSRNAGIEVDIQDNPEGWQTLAGLQSELARRAPVPLVDKPLVERISRYWLRGGSGGTVLVAHRNHEALAAALLITYRDTAYLPVIPSSVRNRDLPSSHLLVWEAARWARERGCVRLDLVGYSMTAQPGDPLWGVNQFKRGFAQVDHLARSVAEHEIVLSPVFAAMAAATRRVQARLGRRPVARRMRTDGPRGERG